MSGRYRRAGEVAVAGAAAALAYRYTVHLLATTFFNYDDEGYFLLAARRYVESGLRDSGVFGHYGPLHLFAQGGLYRLLNLPVNHDAGRWITQLHWLAAAALCALFAYRISRSVLLSAAGGLACLCVAAVLTHEPGHPQQILVVLMLLGACVSLSVSGAAMLVLGALGGALFLTKVNAGLFFLVALAQALVSVLPPGRLRSAAQGALLVYAAAAAPWLMRGQWTHGASVAALVASLVTTATFFAASRVPVDGALRMRGAVTVVCGAVATALGIFIATLAQGITLAEFLEGVFLEPMRLSGLLFVGFRLGWWWLAAAAAATAAIACLRWFPYYVEAARLAGGLLMALLLVRTDLAFAVTLAPLVLVPPAGRRWTLSEAFPRVFVACLAATEFLHTFPIAGSQIGVSSIPVLLAALFCVVDGAAGLRALPRGLLLDAASAAILAACTLTVCLSGMTWTGYANAPSQLHGAASLHLPAAQAATYRRLSQAIAADCSLLFTLPRMPSFNFWSGVPASRTFAVSGLTKAYTAAQQQAILEELRAESRPCALYNREILALWQTTPADLTRMPLARAIEAMPVKLTDGGYELRVPERAPSR